MRTVTEQVVNRHFMLKITDTGKNERKRQYIGFELRFGLWCYRQFQGNYNLLETSFYSSQLLANIQSVSHLVTSCGLGTGSGRNLKLFFLKSLFIKLGPSF